MSLGGEEMQTQRCGAGADRRVPAQDAFALSFPRGDGH